MKTIDYDSITDVLLNISDPNTWAVVSQVPWVSAPKINAGVSVYNVEADGWSGIAWWSTNVSWSASDYNTVAWSSGSVYLPDWTSLTVTSGNTGNMSSMTYIYYDRSTNTVSTTTSANDSVWENKVLLCVAKPTSSWKDAEFQAFWTNAQSTFITADNIAANTITGNEIQANSITAWEIDVSQLSAISANLGTITAWDITWTTITAWSTSGRAVKLDPTGNRIEFYYGGNLVWYIIGWGVNGHWWMILNADYVWMLGRDEMDLYWAKLRIPVWTDLYS
jgi:hypothetical protein